MLFYLDKELAKHGIAKCIAVSEEEISQGELEGRKKSFNVQEILVYEGLDIPHKFKYNETLNSIEELTEIEEIVPRTSSEENQEIESEFDEDVEVDPEKQYFYLDKAYADKFNKSQVIAVFPKPLKKPSQYFQKEVYCYFGKDIPFYISVDDGSTIREATEEEKLERKQRALAENELLIDGKIVSYDTHSQKVVDNKIVEKTREDYIKEGLVTIETEKEKARAERDRMFNALDLYDKAVLRGDIKETTETKSERDEFRQAWLELPNNYVDLNVPIESLYPTLPVTIAYFVHYKAKNINLSV